jgi:hypothetical protein
MKNAITPPEIEPTTFRLVAQSLNHLRQHHQRQLFI